MGVSSRWLTPRPHDFVGTGYHAFYIYVVRRFCGCLFDCFRNEWRFILVLRAGCLDHSLAFEWSLKNAPLAGIERGPDGNGL